MAEPAAERSRAFDLLEQPWWQGMGACNGADVGVFFAERGSGDWFKAKAVCAACRVVTECLLAALTCKEKFGTWGGRSVTEREALARHLPALLAQVDPRLVPSLGQHERPGGGLPVRSRWRSRSRPAGPGQPGGGPSLYPLPSRSRSRSLPRRG